MVRAVLQAHLAADDLVAGQRALLHRLLEALVDGRDVLAGMRPPVTSSSNS